MSKQPAFWDSSAMVPLCVHESTSRQAHAQLRKFLPVVWWGSLVEVHSAIARLHRLGQLTDAEEREGSVSTRSAEPRLEGDSPWRSRARIGDASFGRLRLASGR